MRNRDTINFGEDEAIKYALDEARKVEKDNLIYLKPQQQIEPMPYVEDIKTDDGAGKKSGKARIRFDDGVGIKIAPTDNPSLDKPIGQKIYIGSSNGSSNTNQAAVSFVLVIVAILILVAIVAIVAVNMIPYIQSIGLE